MAKLPLGRNVRGRNDETAAENRRRFAEARLCAVNLLSSPGSGKTSLLERTAERMKDRWRILVIDGDVETERDAQRLRAAGLEAIQIQTHGACHLNAMMIAEQVATVDPAAFDLLLIENIGNLVCPSNYDLGESSRVVVASTTEGDDKPIKYPEAYHTADLCVLNKVDLLPYLPFDVAAFEAGVRRVKADMPVLHTSCTTGAGLEAWCAWLDGQVRATRGEPGKS
ncbi:MAG: hydrogenase nickel incorporation protein HypB [Phycisphaerae bacterium]|nr:hydrogenase nickel incorporation protein HypB [Phycisphaerae bacterium]